ncbi:hypothetical protein GJ744_006268 [Endocarpon pusillum]|uniref:Uncharacterized protein n=1 Tax=Endocarpon pusillum TaxID=364733 RepID=A0A8H7E8D3_9EURO|nr:hypothetical protein GJ744_006268 [Endocarpon pusillum]
MAQMMKDQSTAYPQIMRTSRFDMEPPALPLFCCFRSWVNTVVSPPASCHVTLQHQACYDGAPPKAPQPTINTSSMKACSHQSQTISLFLLFLGLTTQAAWQDAKYTPPTNWELSAIRDNANATGVASFPGVMVDMETPQAEARA